jgi:hypothetical protein
MHVTASTRPRLQREAASLPLTIADATGQEVIAELICEPPVTLKPPVARLGTKVIDVPSIIPRKLTLAVGANPPVHRIERSTYIRVVPVIAAKIQHRGGISLLGLAVNRSDARSLTIACQGR